MNHHQQDFSSFDEYLRQGEPTQKEAASNWKTAIGLQAVDGLQPSAYLIDVAKRNIEGEITIEETRKLIDSYYQSKTARTTAIFTIQYLRSLGYKVNNEMFAKHSWYFRNALVRANYRNVNKDIEYTPIYLVRFFRNLLFGDDWVLKNRYLHIHPREDWKVQPNLKQHTEETYFKDEETRNVPSSSQVRPKFVPNSSQVAELIMNMDETEMTIIKIMEKFGLKNRTRFRNDYITPALAENAIERKYPNTPNHPRQQYRLTPQAREWKRNNKGV